MNVIKQVLPPIEVVFIGPTKSECTNSNGALAHLEFSELNGSLCYLPNMQASHLSYKYTMLGSPSTILFLITNLNQQSQDVHT